MNATVGDWGNVFDMTIMGIHQVMLEDGRVLYWGDDGKGDAFSNTQKYGIFDPSTGTHEILNANHAVKMFCGAGVVLPGTDKVLIAGGNGSGQPGAQLFDMSDETLTKDSANNMNAGRFYPTIVSLSSGQAVILGGKGSGSDGTPEIFTLGEGWRELDGAKDTDVKDNWWYPNAWVNSSGEVVYFAINGGNQSGNNVAGNLEVMALDPSGKGSLRQIGELPFKMDAASPATMFDVGKIAIMDHKGDLWIMDINGATPQFTFAADLGNTDRNNADMTVLPDGRLLINGGTTTGNSQSESNAIYESVIYDPYQDTVTTVDSESVMRLYHSSSMLLADGTILSMGGGGLSSTKDFMDAQVYSPDYLFNNDGSLADRPEILTAPQSLKPGETFTITMDDTADLARISFVKTGAVTHSLNMEAGRMDLGFTVVNSNTVEVTLPANPNIVGAGNWMLFALDNSGTPSVAPIISVEPTIDPYTEAGASGGVVDGEITVEYFNANVTSLDQVDFDATPISSEKLTEIQEDVRGGSFYTGGPVDRFAAEYTGTFGVDVSGLYTFYLNSDDGSRLSINGEQIITNDGLHSAQEKAGSVYLEAGVHTLTAQYFEKSGAAVMELDWKRPDAARSAFTVSGNSPVDGILVRDDPSEIQFVEGTDKTDVFVIDGNSGDYSWDRFEEADGTPGIVVWNNTTETPDLLYGFETIRFNDKNVDISGTANPGEGVEVQDDPSRTQYLSGTAFEDTFIIDADRDDYAWNTFSEADGTTGVVVWDVATGKHDILYAFESLRFNDQTVDISASGGPNEFRTIRPIPSILKARQTPIRS